MPTKNFLYDVEGVKGLIDSNTICIIASCPEFPYGNYDPVPQIV